MSDAKADDLRLLDFVVHRKSLAVTFVCAVLFLSALCFYPGIAMTDTITRWESAYTIIGKMYISWWGEQWLAPTMTIFMIPFAVFGTWSLLIAQVAYLSLGAGLWISMSSSRRPYWVPLTFAAPIIFVYASFIVPDVWTLAAILSIVGSVYLATEGRKISGALIFLLSATVLFGFRQNSLALVPVVAVMIISARELPRLYRAFLVALMIAALAMISVMPRALEFSKETSSASAFGWELVGMLAAAHEKGVTIDPALTLDGIGNTDLAIRRYTPVQIDSLIWGDDAPLPRAVVMQMPRMVRGRWMRMIAHHPMLYAIMKSRMYECTMGLCGKYLHTQVEEASAPAQFAAQIATYSSVGHASGALFRKVNQMSLMGKWLLIPAFWLPVTLVVFVLGWKKYGRFDRWLIVMGAAYMLSFFILNQAASFRYLLPTYVIFLGYQFRLVGSLIMLAGNKASRVRNTPSLGK